MQKIQTLENVVGKRVAGGCFLQRLSWPALAALKTAVEFAETGYELALLLLKHLDISLLAWSARETSTEAGGGTYPLG